MSFERISLLAPFAPSTFSLLSLKCLPFLLRMDKEPPARMCSPLAARSEPSMDLSSKSSSLCITLAAEWSPQAQWDDCSVMLLDCKSFVLIKVLFAVLKNDIEVARIDYSNSIQARRSSSSSTASASVISTGEVTYALPSPAALFMQALCGRVAAALKPEVVVEKKPLAKVLPKPQVSILFSQLYLAFYSLF